MKKNNIVIIVLLVISLWMNYSNMNEIKMLRNNMGSSFNRLEDDINHISSNVSNTLNNIKQESLWIRDSHYEVIKLTDDLEYADLEVSISLNEKKKDEKLFIVAVPNNGDDKKKFQIPESEDLTYKLDIRLPSENDYELLLLGENEGNFRSDFLDKVYLRGYKDNIIFINGEVMGIQYNPSNKKGAFQFYIDISKIKTSGDIPEGYLKDLEIAEIKADVYYGEKLVVTMDLLKGYNYTTIEMEDISKDTPEMEAIIEEKRSEYKREYFFSGEHEIVGESEMPDVILLIKVKDNKDNTYKGIAGDYYHYVEMFEKLMRE